MSPNLDLVLDNFQVAAPVPEPGTYALALIGGAGLLLLQRRRSRAQALVRR